MQTAPDQPPRRMVVYTRISDDREGRQNGVDRQERQCRALADKNGDEVVAVFTDDDRSAYSGRVRPDYANMIKFLQGGNADGILALTPTRLYRALYEPKTRQDYLHFHDLVTQLGLAVQTVKAGRWDLSTADGRKAARDAASQAQYESELIAERVRDAKADNLRDGTYRGGPRPFGYEADGVTVRETEAAYLRDATDAIIAGDSLRSVCRAWAAAGVRTVARRFKQEDGSRSEPQDRDWTPTELRKLLLRPRNAGLIDHRGEIVGTASWPAIVSEDKWRAVKAVLERPERRTSPGAGRVWLGTGLYRCGTPECTETVRCSTSGKGSGDSHVPAYRCRSGKHVTRVAAPLDEHITNLVLVRLSRPDAAAVLLPPSQPAENREELAATANGLRGKLEALAADYADDLLTRQQLLDATALTRKRLEKVELQMEAQAQQSVLAGLPLGDPDRLDAEWPDYHLDRRRAIVDSLMTVTILPAPRGRPAGFQPGLGKTYFRPDSVRIEWKHPG